MQATSIVSMLQILLRVGGLWKQNCSSKFYIQIPNPATSIFTKRKCQTDVTDKEALGQNCGLMDGSVLGPQACALGNCYLQNWQVPGGGVFWLSFIICIWGAMPWTVGHSPKWNTKHFFQCHKKNGQNMIQYKPCTIFCMTWMLRHLANCTWQPTTLKSSHQWYLHQMFRPSKLLLVLDGLLL